MKTSAHLQQSFSVYLDLGISTCAGAYLGFRIQNLERMGSTPIVELSAS
jgi:hypothetical protein